MCIYLYGAAQKLDVIFFKKVRFYFRPTPVPTTRTFNKQAREQPLRAPN